MAPFRTQIVGLVHNWCMWCAVCRTGVDEEEKDGKNYWLWCCCGRCWPAMVSETNSYAVRRCCSGPVWNEWIRQLPHVRTKRSEATHKKKRKITNVKWPTIARIHFFEGKQIRGYEEKRSMITNVCVLCCVRCRNSSSHFVLFIYVILYILSPLHCCCVDSFSVFFFFFLLFILSSSKISGCALSNVAYIHDRILTLNYLALSFGWSFRCLFNFVRVCVCFVSFASFMKLLASFFFFFLVLHHVHTAHFICVQNRHAMRMAWRICIYIRMVRAWHGMGIREIGQLVNVAHSHIHTTHKHIRTTHAFAVAKIYIFKTDVG